MAGDLTFKNFNFCWCINDFQYNTEQLIQSIAISIPPFSGVHWCLRVKLLDPGNVGSFDCYLHRIPSEPGPDYIFVDFDIKVSGSCVQSLSQEFRNVKFFNIESYPTDSTGVKMNVQVLNSPYPPSELEINCEIHRYKVEDSYTTKFYYKNFLSLSNDMLSLNVNRYHTDLTLVVQRHSFLTHKAIIDARLPCLSKIFNVNYATESEIEVFGMTPPIMKSLLHYAYTGCLSVENYSHLQVFHNLAGALELTDLQRLMRTTSNKCVARSTMNIQKKSFTWILNPAWTWIAGEDMAATILAHNIGFAKTLTVSWGPVEFDSSLFLNFKFQFSLMLIDHPIFMRCTFRIIVESTIIHAGTLQNLFRSNAIWSSGPLIAKYLLDAYNTPITFQFDIELCDGEKTSYIEASEAEVVFPIPVSRNIEKLSYDLRNLFETGKFCDLTIVTQYKMEIRAHRAILVSRSKTFHTLIKKYLSSNYLPIHGISNEALLFVLHYIYTGRTKGFNLTNVQEFSIAAKYFQIPELVSETEFFVESVNLQS